MKRPPAPAANDGSTTARRSCRPPLRPGPAPDADYDLRDPLVRANPYPVLARLRREDPVHWHESLRCWMLTRYTDVRLAHTAAALGSDRIRPFYEQLADGQRETLAEVVHYLNLWLVFRAPPGHTRLRRLLGAAFTLPVVRSLEPGVRQIVMQAADTLEDRREVEFIGEFAMRVPALVILDMLGVPRSMLGQMKAWSDDLLGFIGGARGVSDKYERAQRGAQNMAACFRDLIAQRRVRAREDILSRLIAARDRDDALSEDELIASCMLIVFGGHETTTNLIGNALHCLLANPSELARLRAEPGMIDGAIEEVLRYDGPTNSSARIVLADHDVGGRRLLRGERVFAMVNAANRDPDQFDDPDRFRIDRSPNPHLAFGQGIHFCMGAPLARMEARLAVGEIVRRFPRLAFAAGKAPEWTNAMIMRGLQSLPLTLD